jgi:hypothetical protein
MWALGLGKMLRLILFGVMLWCMCMHMLRGARYIQSGRHGHGAGGDGAVRGDGSLVRPRRWRRPNNDQAAPLMHRYFNGSRLKESLCMICRNKGTAAWRVRCPGGEVYHCWCLGCVKDCRDIGAHETPTACGVCNARGLYLKGPMIPQLTPHARPCAVCFARPMTHVAQDGCLATCDKEECTELALELGGCSTCWLRMGRADAAGTGRIIRPGTLTLDGTTGTCIGCDNPSCSVPFELRLPSFLRYLRRAAGFAAPPCPGPPPQRTRRDEWRRGAGSGTMPRMWRHCPQRGRARMAGNV